MKKFNNKYYKKAKVVKDKNMQLRVLYKKVGENPKVKIITDVEGFKKAVVLDKLDIIPYKHVFIICNNQEHKTQMPVNVFFNLNNITGDLLVVNIDKEKQEFKSLSQDQLLYYSKDLMGREPNNIKNNYNSHSKIVKKNNYTPFEREIETGTITQDNSKIKITNPNFEKTVIHILINIELMLANLLKNKTNGENKNDE